MNRSLVAAVILVLVVAAVALVVVDFGPAPAPEPEPVAAGPAQPEKPVSAPAAEVPPATPPAPALPVLPEAPAEPLPPLDESDEAARQALTEQLGEQAVEQYVVGEDVLRKAVVTVDNLPRDSLAMRLRVVPPLSGQFRTSGEEDEIYLSPDNFDRYDGFVDMVERLDVAAAVDVYARYYARVQEAYAELGYPDKQFNERLIAAIDDLLRTPEPEGPIRLVRPHVLYKFADPELEALSVGQKALIRMGPGNAAVVKDKLRELRSQLLIRSRTLGPGGAAEASGN